MFARFASPAVLGAVALCAACSGPSPSPDSADDAATDPTAVPDPAIGETVSDPTADVSDPAADAPDPTELAARAVSAQADGPALTGEQVVEYVCSHCHSMDPPPLTAPPLTHLARHLQESFTTVDAAASHVVSYAASPDAEHSILPDMAQERFGLMPAQPLPPDMLDAAARYIWALSDGTESTMGPGASGEGGMGRGMMRRRGGMNPDSAGGGRGMNRRGQGG